VLNVTDLLLLLSPASMVVGLAPASASSSDGLVEASVGDRDHGHLLLEALRGVLRHAIHTCSTNGFSVAKSVANAI
jgi:hypothetical protein